MTLTGSISLTPGEYLQLERASEAKHEYRLGDITPMMGFTPRHSLIAVSTLVCLHEQLRETQSKVYTGQMRVKTPDAALYTYPDVMIVSGHTQFEDENMDTLLNPSVLIEILSGPTADYDRGEKFKLYQAIPSFQEYLLINQDEPHIDNYLKQANGWKHESVTGLQAVIHLYSVNATLELSKVYEQVKFESSEGTDT